MFKILSLIFSKIIMKGYVKLLHVVDFTHILPDSPTVPSPSSFLSIFISPLVPHFTYLYVISTDMILCTKFKIHEWEKTWCLSFWDRFNSLHMVFSGCIHFPTISITSLFNSFRHELTCLVQKSSVFCYCFYIFISRDAWSSLGDMTKEEAMIAYVEEMKKVGKIIHSRE